MDFNAIIAKIEKVYPDEAASLTEHQTTFSGTLEKVGTLEKDLKASSEKRDQLKTIIRSATGLDEITEDGLKGVLSKNGDEATGILNKEIDQLKTKLGASAKAVDAVSEQYEHKIFGLNMDRAVNLLGASDEVHSPHAYAIVAAELSKGAEFGADGAIMYKNDDGTTLYGENGKEATLQTQYDSLKANDNFKYLFKEQFKTGGGKGGGATGPQNDAGGAALRRSKMNEEEKVAYISKYTMTAYSALPF